MCVIPAPLAPSPPRRRESRPLAPSFPPGRESRPRCWRPLRRRYDIRPLRGRAPDAYLRSITSTPEAGDAQYVAGRDAGSGSGAARKRADGCGDADARARPGRRPGVAVAHLRRVLRQERRRLRGGETARRGRLRPPLQAREVDAAGAARWVGPDHPVQRLLDTANGWWSRSDLLIATETYLCLWGAAFWLLGRSDKASAAPDEIWALRPDRVRVVRDPNRYVAGFVYEDRGKETALLPEEVVWFRYFNPMEEFAGFSPLAAARLTGRYGHGRAPLQPRVLPQRRPAAGHRLPLARPRHRRATLRVLRPHRVAPRRPRPRPPSARHRDGWDVQRLGLSQRDMEWLAGLRWSPRGRRPRLRRPFAPPRRLQPRDAQQVARRAACSGKRPSSPS